jgi:ABC-type transport system involved in cytochrome c biogenesis ATPase subunit
MAHSTRRRFLQAAAVGATLPLIAEAGDPPASADAALTAIVRLRFKHLTEAQVKTVQAGIQRGLAMADALKRFPLDPVDEPATIFVADSAE